jgi:hypothetical protein
MDSQTWAAVGAVAAAVIAVAALYYSYRSSRAADRAAKAAEEQTQIQRQLRIDAAQPYVWADVRPDESETIILNLVIGNSGPTIATDVRVTIDPPLPAHDQLKDRVSTAQEMLADGISSIPPGRTLTWMLGPGFDVIAENGPQAHTCTVTANGPFGPVPPLTYTLDIAHWRGQPARQTGNLHQVTKAITDLASKVSRLDRPSPRGTLPPVTLPPKTSPLPVTHIAGPGTDPPASATAPSSS